MNREEIREELLEILEDIKAGIEVDDTTRLVSDGLLKSFDVMLLVTEIGNTFDIRIPVSDLRPENFDTIPGIVELIERLQEEGDS